MQTCTFFQGGYCKKGDSCLFVHQVDKNDLESEVLRQVEYWFGDTNFEKDKFLQEQASQDGYISLRLIASFPRMQKLTTSMDVIVRALEHSQVVQLNSEKTMIRKRSYPQIATSNPPQQGYSVASMGACGFFQAAYPPPFQVVADSTAMHFGMAMNLKSQYPQFFPGGSYFPPPSALPKDLYGLTESASPSFDIFAESLYNCSSVLDPSTVLSSYGMLSFNSIPDPHVESPSKGSTPKMSRTWASPPSSPFVLSPPCPNIFPPISPSYIDVMLNSKDAQAYKAAGVLLYRYKQSKGDSPGRLQVMLGVEDITIKQTACLSLILLGGGKIGLDKDATSTALREFTSYTGDALRPAAGDIEDALRSKRVSPPATLLWYREGRYILYLVQAPQGMEFPKPLPSAPSKQQPQKLSAQPPEYQQKRNRISSVAWVDVRSMLDAVRDGTVNGDAHIREGDMIFGIYGTTRNVLSQRPLVTHLNAMLRLP